MVYVWVSHACRWDAACGSAGAILHGLRTGRYRQHDPVVSDSGAHGYTTVARYGTTRMERNARVPSTSGWFMAGVEKVPTMELVTLLQMGVWYNISVNCGCVCTGPAGISSTSSCSQSSVALLNGDHVQLSGKLKWLKWCCACIRTYGMQ